jgi:hypothetical protein
MDRKSHEVHWEEQHSARRGDLLIVLGAKKFLVDVTIPRSTAPTALSNPSFRAPGACMAEAERVKRDGYEELCKQRGLFLVPFVMESYGGVSTAARQLEMNSKRNLSSSMHSFDWVSNYSVEMRSSISVVCNRFKSIRLSYHVLVLMVLWLVGLLFAALVDAVNSDINSFNMDEIYLVSIPYIIAIYVQAEDNKAHTTIVRAISAHPQRWELRRSAPNFFHSEAIRRLLLPLLLVYQHASRVLLYTSHRNCNFVVL